jgi:hypothetical protein
MQADSDNEDETPTAKELAKLMGVKKAQKPHLSVVQWMAAYERYALAAVVTGQWDMTTALASSIYKYEYDPTNHET